MQARLVVFIIAIMFSSNVFAEYYLVYPVANIPCEPCYKKTYPKKHHVKKTKKIKKKYYTKRKRSSYASKIHYPCAGVVRTNCCVEYVSSKCGRPDYVVFTAPSRDCETYEGIEAGERYDDMGNRYYGAGDRYWGE